MPPKIRELMAELEKAGFENKGGKGSHRNYQHPASAIRVTVSGKPGADALPYQTRAVKKALEDSKR